MKTTTIETISTLDAVRLAQSYHDAMNMVSSQSSFGVGGTASPRQILETYLQACKIAGVKLHNDSWERRAERVVEELSQKRRNAWVKLVRARKEA